jgi:putative transposase
MRFAFIAKQRTFWPVARLYDVWSVSQLGFDAWLNDRPGATFRSDETFGAQLKAKPYRKRPAL